MDTEIKDNDELLTMGDIASEFNIHRSTVSRWISRYGLKAKVIGKNTHTIKRSDLDHFLATTEIIRTKKSQPDPESD